MAVIGIPFDGDIPLAAIESVLRQHLGDAPGRGWVRLVIERPGPGRGPGTELKRMLSRIGIRPAPGCPCLERAAEMDRREAGDPGWCATNIDTIVGWLREEAGRRGLPFVDAAGRLLVRRAIANARRAANGTQGQG